VNDKDEGSNFDLLAQLDNVLVDLGMSRRGAVDAINVDGEDPIMKSVARLGAVIGIPLLAVGTGIASIWQERCGQSQILSIDLRKAIHTLSPFMGGWTRLNGYVSNMGDMMMRSGGSLAMGHQVTPLFFDIYQCRGGRWVVPTGPYPHLRDAFLVVRV